MSGMEKTADCGRSVTTPDLTTPEGMQAAMRIVLREEFNRFIHLQREFICQIADDVLREEMQDALARMESLHGA